MPGQPESSPSEDPATSLLIDHARDGDEAALDELLRLHLPALHAFVRLEADRTIRDKESCSDLVQSVCRDVLQNLDRFEYRGPGSFRNWLFTWAHNKINNRRRYWAADRRNARHEAGSASLLATYTSICSPSRAASAKEQIARFESAFDRLPAHYRETIILVRLSQLPIPEAAVQMGRSVESVKSLLKRATLRLATLLDVGEPAGEGH